MAFSFSNAGNSSPFGSQPQANGTAQASEGPELQEIQTNEVGFLPLAGEAKVKLLPAPWPSDSLPPPSSSLLSIASSKGLLAAAGPDTLVIASTDAVRDTFRSEGTAAQKDFEPQARIAVPRVSQVAFSGDESVLVISAAEGGGLAAYDVSGLVNGKTEPAVQIATNNTPLRALAPNPNAEHAQQVAAVTTSGELLVADLKSGQLAHGTNGPILRSGVSSISWSNRGKQLVAGLADGSAVQMKPDGQVQAEIPRPPSLGAGMHVSCISWLENDAFLTVYTPNDVDDGGMTPASDYYIVNRQKGTTNFAFQKLPEVCAPFGMSRQPSVQMVARLRIFPPHIQDMLIMAATTSSDIGLVTKSAQALSTENAIETFATTLMADDSRRAALPLSGGNDTSPIGLALDLSSREKVDNPILGDPEVLQSEQPLPCIMVLNNEGILAAWWVIYSASIREKQIYSGMAVAKSNQAASTAISQPAPPTTPAFGQTMFGSGQPAFGSSTTPKTGPAFGQSAFGSPAAPPAGGPAFGQGAFTSNTPGSTTTTFGKPSFGQPSTTAFGQSGGPSFGATTAPGGNSGGFGKPSWASTGFGQPSATPNSVAPSQPAFGAPSQPGGTTPAFGSTSAIGSKSPFGAAANSPGFGQSGFGTAATFGPTQQKTSPFGAPVESSNPAFASFANAGGFGAAKPSGESPFGKPATDNPFGKPPTQSIFGQKQQAPSFGSNMDVSSSFGPETKPSAGGLFEKNAGGFKLGSSFKPDGTAADDLPKPKESEGGLAFGAGFGNLLGEGTKEAKPAQDKEEEMDETSEEPSRVAEPQPQPLREESTITEKFAPKPTLPSKEEKPYVTPPGTVIHSKATPAPSLSSLFGTQTQPSTTPAEVRKSKPFSFSNFASTTPTGPPKTVPFPAQPNAESTPKIKTEPPSEGGSPTLDEIPEAPLPPDSTSKATYTIGDTSVSSIGSRESKDSGGEDAPLPPDFLPPKLESLDAGQAELPEGGSDLSSNFSGSEDELSQQGSPTEVASHTAEEEEGGEEDEEPEQTSDFKESPESSFSKVEDRSPTGELFTKITPISPQPRSTNRPLFGEIQPVFQPPKLQESPRSPSPVRQFASSLLRPEASRSASAPIRPGSAIAAKRAELSRSQIGLPQPAQEESRRIQHAKQVASTPKIPPEEPQLEDDEAERLHAELQLPIEPSEELDSFLYHQESAREPTKPGMAGQIERLYQDINSMIDTLGLNARALSAFLLYQQTPHQKNESWPEVLRSELPSDAHDEDWLLVDIERLDEGYDTLVEMLQETQIEDIPGKLQKCRDLLSKDLVQLRAKLMSIRKTLHAHAHADSATKTNLSSEQVSIQHDLRKSSTMLQSKIADAEQGLVVLRAKLAEVPQGNSHRPQRKPTVEAVTATISKMTTMAEQKSADIDVLEAQLSKLSMGHLSSRASLNGSRQGSVEPEIEPRTPGIASSRLRESVSVKTPASSGSVYHTPDSKFGVSVRGTPGRLRSSLRDSITDDGVLVSSEEADKWRQKAQRRKAVETALKEALKTRRLKALGKP